MTRRIGFISIVSIFIALLLFLGAGSFCVAYAGEAVTLVYEFDGVKIAETYLETGEVVYEELEIDLPSNMTVKWSVGDREISFPYTVSIEDAVDGTITLVGEAVPVMGSSGSGKPEIKIFIKNEDGAGYVVKMLTKNVGDTLTYEELESYGDIFCLDESCEDNYTFPITVEGDIVMYTYGKLDLDDTPDLPDDGGDGSDGTNGDNGSTDIPDGGDTPGSGDNSEDIYENAVESVDCEHAEIMIEGLMTAGTPVEITIYDYEDGYALDELLVTCAGEVVPHERSGNVFKIIMPDGKLKIEVRFKESSSVDVEEEPLLGTKEIIAICVAGTVLVGGGAMVIIKNRKK